MVLTRNKILVLAFGNDIMGDSAAALIVARKLKVRFQHGIDIFEASIAGFVLTDILEGYKRVLILDSISKRRKKIGDIFEIDCNEFDKVVSWSDQYTGLHEMICKAKEEKIKFPTEIKFLAIDIEKRNEIREGLSPAIKEKIPDFVSKASEILRSWLKQEELSIAKM